jgi:hypothetical protein
VQNPFRSILIAGGRFAKTIAAQFEFKYIGSIFGPVICAIGKRLARKSPDVFEFGRR